ncbi:MAG: DUF222 domain-containing protein [Actinomycetes bacterium]
MSDSSTRWASAIGALSTVQELVNGVAAASDGVTAAAWLSELQVTVRRLDAARVRLLGVTERTGVWSDQGYLSPASFLRHELRVEHGAARADLIAARALTELPTLAAAFAAGEVSRAAVDKIISVGTRNRTRENLLPRFEAIFTDVAASQPFAILARALTMWAEQVDPLPIIDWPQDPSQARADALVGLARLATASGDLPECGGIAPTVVVTVPLARLESDCTIHRMALDPAGMPLDVGRATRTIPRQIRIALNQRDQGCAYPGCERPPGWCAAHHIQHWADGGPTSIDNLILLCDRHYHKIHDTNHTITIEPSGKPKITKPRWPAAA